MSEPWRQPMRLLPTGVPGLDPVLGGGLPEYSLTAIAGGLGTGKTTLATQILFANATPERPGLYFTVLGEPTLKTLRYQQRMGFFDAAKVGRTIRFVNLSEEAMSGDLGRVLDGITRRIEESSPGLVVIDSFRGATYIAEEQGREEMQVASLLQRLTVFLASWQTTSLVVGEYEPEDFLHNPLFSAADGALLLSQSLEHNAVVRKLQVVKMRGQPTVPGLHPMRITPAGIRVFPRLPVGPEVYARHPGNRLSTGVPGLDEMMGGGVPRGDAVLVAGPTGTGKTLLSTQFVAAGLQQGEPAVVALFEEHPQEYLARARSLGFDLRPMIERKMLNVLYLRPLELSIDETLEAIRDAVGEVGAQRVVIDSLSGFELALAPSFREEFRESMYRMVGALTGIGVTVWLTAEVAEAFNELHLSPHAIAFMADDVLLERYVEISGQLRRFITVVKMRSSHHSQDLRAYEITDQGVVIGETLREYRGVITGVPEPRAEAVAGQLGLAPQEAQALLALSGLGEGTVDAVAGRSGLAEPAALSALERLAMLGLALRTEEDGRVVYRPVAAVPA